MPELCERTLALISPGALETVSTKTHTMDLLRSLEYFHRTVELGSFSAAAQALGLSPAAVSKQVGELERHLGQRLFARSTRHLTLTEVGNLLLTHSREPAQSLRQLVESLAQDDGQPRGVLRMSVAPGFARSHVLPHMPEFLRRYPALELDWSFENRRVDLVREGFDAAIGAGLAPDSTAVARTLVPLKILTVASPVYLASRGTPADLAALWQHDCIRLRSASTGRLRPWEFEVDGRTQEAPVRGRTVVNDPDAVCDAALNGMGLARLGAHHVLEHLQSGRLVRVLAHCRTADGAIQLYYPHFRHTPAKLRVLVDYLVQALESSGLARAIAALDLP